jgi:hypothetical protein
MAGHGLRDNGYGWEKIGTVERTRGGYEKNGTQSVRENRYGAAVFPFAILS